MRALKNRRAHVLVAVVAGGLACGGDGTRPSGPATSLEAVSGDGQTAVVTTSLESPYRVRARDAQGTPVPGVIVTWSVTAGGGSIAPLVDTTAATGISSATHRMGTTPGPQAAQASVTGLTGSPVAFTATADPAPASAGVDVTDNTFAPRETAVTPNGTVTWTWRGAAQHNVTFEDMQGNSTTQSSGTHGRTFFAQGTYRYRCTVHSDNFTRGMVGSVTVP